MPPWKEGQNAPAFEGIDQDNKKINLDDYSGKKVILYFYPKDNTPGCTAEACNLATCNSATRYLQLGSLRWPTTSQPAISQPAPLAAPLIETSPETCILAPLVIAIILNMLYSGFSLADACCPRLFSRPGHLLSRLANPVAGAGRTHKRGAEDKLSPTGCKQRST
jgi:hypothetical protein